VIRCFNCGAETSNGLAMCDLCQQTLTVACVSTCDDCGKRCFLAKGDAKRAIRSMKGRVGKLHVYRCGDYWHLGHIPTALARGRITRDQVKVRR
jgi:hypothetical protein